MAARTSTVVAISTRSNVWTVSWTSVRGRATSRFEPLSPIGTDRTRHSKLVSPTEPTVKGRPPVSGTEVRSGAGVGVDVGAGWVWSSGLPSAPWISTK